MFWLAAAAGYCVDFAAIMMHAVASDDDSCGKPCLYCQLDGGEEGEGGLGGGSSGSEEEGEGGPGDVLPELRLIPADPEQRERGRLLPPAGCLGSSRLAPPSTAAAKPAGPRSGHTTPTLTRPWRSLPCSGCAVPSLLRWRGAQP